MSLISDLSQKIGSDKILSLITKSSDLILAAWIVAIIAMMIIPIPPFLIDIVIAFNLAAAIGLLMVAIYVSSALQLSVFPSLLLITTLFRLGINISSTRQILLHAYAGHIIQAFGQFVVGGNFIVGGIIFLIIIVVQFIVITKGAERVAEVAARFRLDAMPGKQMSIDADMRAGVLNANQAREKRAVIQRESELYGAMDGAMKFVKGDVIAGMIITIINVVGGLIIGVAIHGMTAIQAAKTYSLLSIGDGLVSIIPSFLISVTAGIVTTRVSSDRRDTNLGKEISTQIFKQPKAMMIAGGILVCMGFIPGFPTTIFIILSCIIGGIGYKLWSNEQKAEAKSLASGGEGLIDTDTEGHKVITPGKEDFALTLPVILELSSSVSKLIQDKTGQLFIDDMIPKMRLALYQDMGIRYPGVHVRTDSQTLEEDEYAMLLNEVPIIRGRVFLKHLLCNESQENLLRYNIPAKSYKSSLGLPSMWVEDKYIDILQKARIKFWKPLEVVILHLSYFFRHYSSEFLGIQEVRSMLEFIEKSFPDLVKEVTRLVPLQKMTEIFKRLAQEQVSIKDLRTILEALSEWAQSEKDTVLLTEYVRSSLKRYISFKHSQGQTTLAVYLLDPEIEDMIRGAIKQTSAGSYLALDPDSVQLILQAMRSTIAPASARSQSPVLLTAIDVRRFVRKLVEMEFPEIAVVSYQEIIPEIRIQPLGRIQIA